MKCTISSANTRANLPHTGKRYSIHSCIAEGTGFKYRTVKGSNHFLTAVFFTLFFSLIIPLT